MNGVGLAEHLRGAAWMDDVGRVARRFQVMDAVDVDGAAGSRSLLLAAPENQPGCWYAVPVDERGRPLDGCGVLDELIIDGMRRQRRIPTRRGGLVSFHGDPPPFQGLEAFDAGWSSNSLSMVRLGGIPHVHKRYRIVSSGIHEPEVLRRAGGTGCLPEYAGDYAYVDRDGARIPLGVVYRHVPGEPLEGLLRDNLRTLWTVVSTGGGVTQHAGQLSAVLRAAGRLIRRLHLTLAAKVAPGTDFAIGACVARTEGLMRTVMADLSADADHPEPARARIADTVALAVSTASRALARSAAPPGAVGICHGDLHLSHLICQAAPNRAWRVHAIDVSSRAIDAHDPEFVHQSPWEDLVAVRRGLEAFAAHEAAVHAADILGADRHETCRVAVHDACLTLDSPAVPGQPRHARSQIFDGAGVWSAAAFRLVLEGYGADAREGTAHPLWRLLYLRRLLHELRYNYAHRRRYQVNVDLRYAAALGS